MKRAAAAAARPRAACLRQGQSAGKGTLSARRAASGGRASRDWRAAVGVGVSGCTGSAGTKRALLVVACTLPRLASAVRRRAARFTPHHHHLPRTPATHPCTVAMAAQKQQELKSFSREEVAKVRRRGRCLHTPPAHAPLTQHNKPGDLWIIIDAKVYNLSKFAELVSGACVCASASPLTRLPAPRWRERAVRRGGRRPGGHRDVLVSAACAARRIVRPADTPAAACTCTRCCCAPRTRASSSAPSRARRASSCPTSSARRARCRTPSPCGSRRTSTRPTTTTRTAACSARCAPTSTRRCTRWRSAARPTASAPTSSSSRTWASAASTPCAWAPASTCTAARSWPASRARSL
jgi:hypothetical protein